MATLYPNYTTEINPLAGPTLTADLNHPLSRGLKHSLTLKFLTHRKDFSRF